MGALLPISFVHSAPPSASPRTKNFMLVLRFLRVASSSCTWLRSRLNVHVECGVDIRTTPTPVLVVTTSSSSLGSIISQWTQHAPHRNLNQPSWHGMVAKPALLARPTPVQRLGLLSLLPALWAGKQLARGLASYPVMASLLLPSTIMSTTATGEAYHCLVWPRKINLPLEEHLVPRVWPVS